MGGLTLGNIDASGTLNANSTGGAITQAASTTILVDGAATLNASNVVNGVVVPADITLNGATNDFAGTVNAAGGNITLDWPLLNTLPNRFWGVLSNETLLAIPFFTFMGIVLERSGMAEDLLDTIGQLFGPIRGGLAYAVIFVGALLAATTGVVAASVIAMQPSPNSGCRYSTR